METLDEINEMYVKKLMPNIIWMFFCLFTGVIGNSLVLLVYRLRMKTELNERYFIPILAFLDLLASLISSLHGILNYMLRINYPSEIMCIFFNFGSFFTAAASAHTLLLIAIQRYRKICVPFGKQMTLFWRRVSFAILIVVTFGYSLPVCFSAGLSHWRKRGHTVSECAIDSGNYPSFYKIFFSIIFFIMVSNLVAVTVLYSMIGCTIFRRGRRKSHKTRTRAPVQLTKFQKSEESSDTNKSVDSGKSSADSSRQGTDISQLSSQLNPVVPATGEINECSTNVQGVSEIIVGNQPERNDDHPSDKEAKMSKLQTCNTVKEDNPKDKHNAEKKKKQKWDRTKVNFNKLFGAIIIFYIISYVPTMVHFVMGAFGVRVDVSLNVFFFVNRMYIINNIVNPFIYGYFDFSFRHAVKSLFKCGKL